jgi:hypothetical protein
MARRTVIEDTSPGYVEDDSGPMLGLIVGLLIAAAIVVLAVLFFNGTFDSDNNGGTPQAPDNAPSAPSNQQTEEPQPSSTP